MNNLIEFFKRAFHIIVLAVLLILSIVMLGKSLSFNNYRLARTMQSIVGPIQKNGAGMMHRFRLGPENESLVQQNIELLRERYNMFAQYTNNKFVLLSIFMKTTNKTPRREIEKAKRFWDDYKKRSG